MAKRVYHNLDLQLKLSSEIESMIADVSDLAKTYSMDELNHKPSPGGWSANECFYHLNPKLSIDFLLHGEITSKSGT